MSNAGRCIARSTSSGMVVGPGIARNSRPARSVIFLIPWLVCSGKGCSEMAGNSSRNTMVSDQTRPCEERKRPSNPAFPRGPGVPAGARHRPRIRATRWAIACSQIERKRLSPGLAAARGFGFLDRAEPARALADLHPDLRVPAAGRLVIDAFAGTVDVALDGAVGRGRDFA